MRRTIVLLALLPVMLAGQAVTLAITSIGNAQVAPGDQVVVNLQVSGLGARVLSDFDLNIGFDAQALTLSRFTLGTALGNFTSSEAIDYSLGVTSPGVLNIAAVSTLGSNPLDALQNDPVPLVRLEFSVAALGAGENTQVRVLNVGALGHGTGQPLTAGTLTPLTLRRPGLANLETVSSASFAAGTVASGSIVTSVGSGLATATLLSGAPQASLGGASVKVKDSAGVERDAMLYFASPTQLNYVIPAASATGAAEITVSVGGQPVARGTIRLETVVPGIYSANSSGQGTAAALATTVDANGTQTVRPTFQCGSGAGSCVGSSINVGDPAKPVYVSLYGTGIRGRSALAAVTVTAGGQSIPVLFAGPTSEFPGMDQVNIGPLPGTLAGRGTVDLILTVDGKPANTVTLTLQ